MDPIRRWGTDKRQGSLTTVSNPHRTKIASAIYYLEQNGHDTSIAHYFCSAAKKAVRHVSPSLSPTFLQAGQLRGFAASVLCRLLHSLCREGMLTPLGSLIFFLVRDFSAVHVVALVL